METTWSLLRNTFDNVTKYNDKRMLLMASDHCDKLAFSASTNLKINSLYQQFLPAFLRFKGAYQKLMANYALYQSCTQAFEEKIAELSATLARKWDVTIQMEYDERSADYKMLLPNGRAPFQTGAYEMRIAAIHSLLISLEEKGNSNLAILIQKIKTWIAETQLLRTKQQGIEQRDSAYRQELEEARQLLATEMHGVFFGLCAIYYQNLVQVETFYELKYLRAKQSSTKEIAQNLAENEQKISPNTTVLVMEGTWEGLTEFMATNTGNTVCSIWASAIKNSSMPANSQLIYPQQTIYFSLEELADENLLLRYIYIKNNSLTAEGKVAIQPLLE